MKKYFVAAILCLLSFSAQAQLYSVAPINGWITFADSPFRVYKDASGIVHMEGLVCKALGTTPPNSGLCGGGGTQEVVAILPYGYRPQYFQRFPIVTALQFGVLLVEPTGEVVVIGDGFWASLTVSYWAP